MNLLEKCAEILVECGYAIGITRIHSIPLTVTRKDEPKGESMFAEVEPFSDTLKGRRQADAIEDWFDDACMNDTDKYLVAYELWMQSAQEIACKSNHQWRLDRIKWCIEELIK